MMTLRVTFLGTSAAVPTTERNPSGILVNREGDRLLFDVGEGTQRQMMRYGTGFTISDIFITHLHGDHIYGLPGLLETMAFMDRTTSLSIHTPPGTADRLRRQLFAVRDPPAYGVRITDAVPGQQVLECEEYVVRAFRTDHDTRSVGYVLEEDDRKGRFDRQHAETLGVPTGPLFGRLHEGNPVELEDGTVVRPEQVVGPPRPGRTVVYTGDTRATDATIQAATAPDLMIHDATFTEADAKRAEETAHATAAAAGRVASKIGARQLALTHISSRYAGDISGHLSEAQRRYDGELFVARDGQTVDVGFPDA